MAFLSDTKAPAGHPLFHLADKLAQRSRLQAYRKSLRAVLKLDDHLLKDIGVSRDQVYRALETPDARDAEARLHRLSLSQASPWM